MDNLKYAYLSRNHDLYGGEKQPTHSAIANS